METETVDVAIIGAELEALSVLDRLSSAVLERTLVVDPSGAWLIRLEAWTRRLAPALLRDPATLHAAKTPTALRSFAEKRSRGEELVSAVPGFGPLPTPSLLLDFHRHMASRLPSACRAVVAASVEELRAADGDMLRVVLSTGRCVLAKSVVHTLSPTRPIVPSWAQSLLGAVEPQNTELESSLDAGGLLPVIQTASALEASALPDLSGRSVAIVGSGMTAGTLALHALRRDAETVTLIARRPLASCPFSEEAGWWGGKGVSALRAASPGLGPRLAAARAAAEPASLHAPVFDALAEAARAGRLRVLEEQEVTRADRAASMSSPPRHVDGADEADGGLSTSSSLLRLHLRSTNRRPGNGAFDTAFRRAISADPETSPPNATLPDSLCAHHVWLACGSACDAAWDPALSGLLGPGRQGAGYPLLDDDTLRPGREPLFVLGRLARGALGPAAGARGALRTGADAAATGLGRALLTSAREAEAVERRLVPRLEALEEERAAGSLVSDAERRLPPKPRVQVDREPHSIDVSDLPPSLPRLGVEKYSLVDDGFLLKVLFEAAAPLEASDVRTLFGAQSLEVWAVSPAGAHRLAVPKLWGRVVPGRCRVRTKGTRVTIVLHKESDAEWRFLKGY